MIPAVAFLVLVAIAVAIPAVYRGLDSMSTLLTIDETHVPPHKLWLDDLRPAPGEDWVTCKTAWEAIDYMKSHYVAVLSLDHDLGPADAGTGDDVVKWLEERAYRGKLVPRSIRIHSANPVGRANMEAGLTNIRAWACTSPPCVADAFIEGRAR